MRIWHYGDVPVMCEIADAAGRLEVVAGLLRRATGDVVDVDALAVGGRGLSIVARLSGGRCGARPTRLCSTGQVGKGVWFGLPHQPRGFSPVNCSVPDIPEGAP
jgi:hypothetical protein